MFEESPQNPNLLTETGFCKPVRDLEVADKHELVTTLVDYHCMLKAKASMDQFLSGIGTLGVRNYLPALKSMLFHTPKPLTVGK